VGVTPGEVAVELACLLEELRQDGSDEWWTLERPHRHAPAVHFTIRDGVGQEQLGVSRLVRNDIAERAVDPSTFLRLEVQSAYRALRSACSTLAEHPTPDTCKPSLDNDAV
jgi:hypothetical protein